MSARGRVLALGLMQKADSGSPDIEGLREADSANVAGGWRAAVGVTH